MSYIPGTGEGTPVILNLVSSIGCMMVSRPGPTVGGASLSQGTYVLCMDAAVIAI